MEQHLAMKRIGLALALWLWPTLAFAQCTGVFAANTLCGNLTGSPQPPSMFSASGTIAGPATSTLNGLPLWANTLGTQLKDGAGLTVAGNYTWGGTQTYSAAQTFNGTATFNSAANFTSTFQIAGNQVTWPAAAGTVPFLGTNQTWTGNNTFNTGTVNMAGTFQIGGATVTLPLSAANGGKGVSSPTARSIPINQGASAETNTGTGTAGQVLYSGGASADPSWQTSAAVSLNPANPTSVSVTAMLGLGTTCTITPVLGGRLRMFIIGTAIASASSNTVLVLRTGTGTAPANGAAAVGTTRASTQATINTSTWFTPFTVAAIFSGNTPGVAVWFDLSMAPSTGTQSVANVTCMAEEF